MNIAAALLLIVGFFIIGMFIGFANGAMAAKNGQRSAVEIFQPLREGEAIVQVEYSNGQVFRLIEPGVWIEIGKDGKKIVRP